MKFVMIILTIFISFIMQSNALRSSMIKTNKNTLDKDLFKDLENFRFKEGSWGPWDSILDAIPDTDKTVHQSFKKIARKVAETHSEIKSGEGDIKKKVARNARHMAEDINCLLGKCKNVQQENRMMEEAKVMKGRRSGEENQVESKSSSKGAKVDGYSPNDKKGFEMQKKKIQAQLDDRFTVLRPYDGLISTDNSIRFYAMDTTTKETLLLKLYFKGDPKNREFYHENTDPKFKVSIQDCLNTKLITNRVYGKPMTNTDTIVEGKDKLFYENIETTRCILESGASGAKTAFYGIYSIPVGEKLSTKCFHGDNLRTENSCIQFLKLVTGGIINGIKILNQGKQFYKHSNIRANNMYLNRRNDTEKIILDNMVYDKETYDDPNHKPYKSDLNMLGETLIQLITGTQNSSEVLKAVPNSPFSIYFQMRRYFLAKSINIKLKQRNLGIKEDIQDYLGKCITLAEMEYRLQKTIFNFIYRLKCSGTNPNDQFMDLNQALQHEYMKDSLKNPEAKVDNWVVEPAHY